MKPKESPIISTSPKAIQSVKRFYFLEYFYVLLKSISKYSEKEMIFESFKILKQEHRLGESKYKKLTSDNENLSKAQVDRYRYTFKQVIYEAKEYELINEDDNGIFNLTNKGRDLLSIYHQIDGPLLFNQALFNLMETKYNAFNYLIKFLYKANTFKPGLIIFPNYSPMQLNFERSTIKTTANFIDYSIVLISRLRNDIKKYLDQDRDLSEENKDLIGKLIDSELLPKNNNDRYDPTKYNVITKRFRDFWITYFLKEIYKCELSMSSFDIWIYRGKQIGVIHATEFYPNFNGRIVYPTSVITQDIRNNDFIKLYDYCDGYHLYVHNPIGEINQEKFVQYLVKGYFDLRRTYRSYFINLTALREVVCYNMKISEHMFERFLDTTYKLNLSGNLKIGISLEVDKLPEETKAMYLKQEPVMVDGKYRNIIAIDITKGEKIL